MAENVIISLIFIAFSCAVLRDSEYLEPHILSVVEESYVFSDTEYIIVNDRVTWNEAELICNAYANGSFAVISNDKIANFLAEALAEGEMDLEHLWVGARKETENGSFVWINGVDVFKDYMINRGAENSNPIRYCLALSRMSHSVPLFVNLECHAKRAFICEKPYEKPVQLGTLTTPDWIVVNNFKYGIFYDKISFGKSVRECSKKQGAHLASFRNVEEVQTVAKFMLIGRPSIERAWIGVRHKAGSWNFIHTKESLSETQDNITKFPPWRYGHSTKHSGCLSLDRHVSSEASFLESRCLKKLSYICEKELQDQPDFLTAIVDKTGYVLYYVQMIWEHAQLQCQRHKADLAIVTQKNVNDVINLMGENHTEIRHVWIGGRLGNDGQFFYWYRTKEKIIPKRVQIKHYPPWYDVDYDRRFACLNLDRENHNSPIFYGADCEVAQPFICSQSDLAALPILQSSIEQSYPLKP